MSALAVVVDWCVCIPLVLRAWGVAPGWSGAATRTLLFEATGTVTTDGFFGRTKERIVFVCSDVVLWTSASSGELKGTEGLRRGAVFC